MTRQLLLYNLAMLWKLLMPLFKIFDLAPFPLSDFLHCICISVGRCWEKRKTKERFRKTDSEGISDDQSHWQSWNKQSGMKICQPVWEHRCFSFWSLSLLSNLSLLFFSLCLTFPPLFHFLFITFLYEGKRNIKEHFMLKQVNPVQFQLTLLFCDK